ncbi:hypothetical protein SAMN05192569_10233 [Parageobacillus thermantarcticus]|uniref:Uncharacterized protein n=1 Tax=Parageobacillus thermantarcticus TaxID=186116 RepID=A0A1I0TE61_9BACL|nr:hypothetical protein SAMN05192569_10233 [Parageobacillus thermantarcticus]
MFVTYTYVTWGESDEEGLSLHALTRQLTSQAFWGDVK